MQSLHTECRLQEDKALPSSSTNIKKQTFETFFSKSFKLKPDHNGVKQYLKSTLLQFWGISLYCFIVKLQVSLTHCHCVSCIKCKGSTSGCIRIFTNRNNNMTMVQFDLDQDHPKFGCLVQTEVQRRIHTRHFGLDQTKKSKTPNRTRQVCKGSLLMWDQCGIFRADANTSIVKKCTALHWKNYIITPI